MSSEFLNRFAREMQLGVHISERDQYRRWSVELLVLLFGLYSNIGPILYLVVGGMAVCEVLAKLVYPKTGMGGTPPSLLLSTVIFLNKTISLTIFLLPAIVLCSYGSTAMLLVGLTWMFGISVYVSNTYAAAPILNWCLMAPTFFVGIYVASTAGGTAFEASGTSAVILALVAMLMFFLNTLETMKQHKDTLAALNLARKDSRRRMQELENLTRQDALTGLLNRRAFDEAAEHLLGLHRSDKKRLTAVFLIDLDGFKPINDSYSHAAGDALLIEIGHRLRRMSPEGAVVARLGGDEFAAAVHGFREEREALDFALILNTVTAEPVEFEGRKLTVGASIGIAIAKPDLTVARLLSNADQAMYQAKTEKALPARLFDPTTCPARATLEDRQALLNAMTHNQLIPYYQPKVNLTTGGICGFEALARWQHPTDGLIRPAIFLPMINDLGLQGDFLLHTLRHTLDDIMSILQAGLDPGQVSVNLTEITLATTSGRETLLNLLREYPMALPYLTFEVTEDIFIARSGSIIQSSISQFRRMGVRISLDDFGTGFASFEHLRELEFDELKLDTGFVRGLGADNSASVLVQAFMDIGRGLHVDVVAEGVETEEQRRILSQMGCPVAQGYLYSKAIPFTDCLYLLQTGTRLPKSTRSNAA